MFSTNHLFKSRTALLGLAAAIPLALGAGGVYGQSQLFVLVNDASELEDLDSVIGQIDVPVHVLDVGALPRLTRQIKDELSFVNDLGVEEVVARQGELERLFSRTVRNKKSTFDDVYQKTTVAGEISTRYGITTTPSVIELDSQGNYRLVSDPDSLMAGVIALEEEGFLRAPPALGVARAARGGSSISNADNINTEMVVLLVNESEFSLPRSHIFPRTPENEHINLTPVGSNGMRYRVSNPEALGDLSTVNLIPTARALSAEPVPGNAEPQTPSFRAEDDGGATPVPSIGTGAQYSVLDSIIDGSSLDSYDCLNLRINGVCTYIVVRVYCSFGCWVEVTPEASIELAHYNPELLVGSYKRLGASPLQEARLLFGDLQLAVTNLTIPAITGESMPDEYMNADLWASAGSEVKPDLTSSTMKYHEVDILGHAGSVFSWMSADDTEPMDNFLDHLLRAPINITAGTGEVVNQLPAALQNSVEVITSTVSAAPDPVILAPTEDPDTYFDNLARPSGGEIILMMNLMFPGGAANAAGQMSSLYGTYTSALSVWNTVATIETNTILENINLVTGIDFEAALETMNSAIAVIEGMGDGFSELGLGAGNIEVWSMCPKSSKFMKPYFLSGLDMIQWKFNLPEIVYPQTYAPPLPAFQDLYVGSGVLNNWGSIYPRQGFTTQPDEAKAAAVNASRAVHVVTRPDQSHIYSYLEPYEELYLDIVLEPEFSPKVEETGKWQPLLPEVEAACFVFGDEDYPLLPWTGDRQTLDRQYAYTYWREAVCCPEPRPAGSVAMVVTPIAKIPLEVELIN